MRSSVRHTWGRSARPCRASHRIARSIAVRYLEPPEPLAALVPPGVLAALVPPGVLAALVPPGVLAAPGALAASKRSPHRPGQS